MSYEEKLNQEALELSIESEEDAAVEEPLFDASDDEDLEIGFEIEIEEPAKEKKAGRIANAVGSIREKCGEARDCVAERSRELRDNLQEKYGEARSACKELMERLSYDMKETGYNPYIRSTTTYRYEILRKSTDEEPVDVFEFERTSGFSLRAMAITTALVGAAELAVKIWLKKRH